MGTIAVLAVTLIWRLPSFFDPPWVNDEGTYFAVAQAMAHGYRLYAGVWENKPFALYLVYEAVYHWLGASLPAIRVLAAAAVLTSVVLIVHISQRFTARQWSLVAGMLAGLVAGVPFLEGTTGNAEIFLIVFTSLAVWLVLCGHPAAAGAAVAVAVLFKAVAGFDAAAIGLWLLVPSPPDPLSHAGRGGEGTRGSGRGGGEQVRALVLYAASALTVLVTAGVIAWMNGILGPMVQDGFLYPLGYVGRANGGSIPWLVLAKLAVLGGLTVWLIRRPFPYLWLAWSAAGALISGRFFGHYAIQALPPLAIVATLGLRAWWSRGVIRGAPPDADGKAARRALTVLPAVFVLLASACALGGWVMAAGGHDSILARRLQWYANFTRLAMGAESYSVYRDQVDDHVTRNIRIAQALDSLPPGPALVWGNIPWVYVLSHRLPATAYTSAYRDPPVPGETVALRRAVMHHRPEIAVVVFPPLPPLGPAAASLSRGYWPVKQIRDATIYVARAPPGR